MRGSNIVNYVSETHGKNFYLLSVVELLGY